MKERKSASEIKKEAMTQAVAGLDNNEKAKVSYVAKKAKKLVSDGKRGRPKVKLDAARVRQLARRGLNKTQICALVDIKLDTLNKSLAEDVALQKEFEAGKAEGIERIASSLIDCAEAGNVQAQIFYLKTQAGWKETQHVEHTFKTHEERLKELE